MKNRTFYIIIAFLITASILFWLNMFQYSPVGSAYESEDIEITMYRSTGCNCCVKWASYLEREGFTVTDHPVDNLIEVKIDQNVPQQLASCHTAVIDGYVVEGHVPAKEIRRLLSERPNATGISVPGMPIGSPGMEQGFQKDPYKVILFDEAGNRSVFAQY